MTGCFSASARRWGLQHLCKFVRRGVLGSLLSESESGLWLTLQVDILERVQPCAEALFLLGVYEVRGTVGSLVLSLQRDASSTRARHQVCWMVR